MQKIIPNIWCNRNAEEAGEYYAATFQNTTCAIEARYPTTGLLEFQQEFAGEPLTVSVSISGYRLSLINAGSEFRPTPALSFMLNFDPLAFDGDEELARKSLDRLWGKLGDAGQVLLELGEYPFSRHYGWVQDRYGVSWQLILTDPAGDPRPFIVPCLQFGAAEGEGAEAAVDHYLSVFEDAELGTRVFSPNLEGEATADVVGFSDFRVGEQWFAAMDSPAAQQAEFTCGVSLEVLCVDQAEIDRLWDALSAVLEAEQCGWLADRFGVSWQIVPRDMGELMERPGAFEHMLEMKKLVIADF